MTTRSKALQRAMPKGSPVDWINVELDKAQQQRLKSSDFDLVKLETALEDLFEQGYKLTVRMDTFNDCYASWLIPSEKSPNAGSILAGRGSTPVKAMKAVIFIHFAILEGVWGAASKSSRAVLDD